MHRQHSFNGFYLDKQAILNKKIKPQRLLEYEIYENTTQAQGSPYAPGSWQAILTSPYTFVNEALFNFYGASTSQDASNSRSASRASSAFAET